MSDNKPVETRAALLIAAAPDPATQGNVIFHHVKDLSKEEFDRYSEAYRVLDGILVANLFTYYMVAAKSLVSLWQEANQSVRYSTATGQWRPRNDRLLGTRLRGAVLSVVSALCYHQERTYEEISEKFEKNGPEHQAAKDSSARCTTTTSGTATCTSSAT